MVNPVSTEFDISLESNVMTLPFMLPSMMLFATFFPSFPTLGATVSQNEVMDWVSGSHASTFGGNPISCQTALTTIELIEEKLVENVVRFIPPLITTQREVDIALMILEKALKKIEKG